MIKLTYTNEMIEQDKLWETESENLELMESLQKQIVTEAVQKGFNGIAKTYTCNGETITEVYYSLEEKEKVENGLLDIDCYGYCKALIEVLENALNNKSNTLMTE